MNRHTIESDIADLVSPHKGFIVKRNFLTPEQADRYRSECEWFLQTNKRIYKKLTIYNRYDKRDFVVSSNGKIIPGQHTYRIYQSLHSKHSEETEGLFQKVLSLRNEIEDNWLFDDRYRRIKQELYDYVQVTTYGKHGGGISKHCDYTGDAPFPLLQCLILLSQPGLDYLGGDLVLYRKSGGALNIQKTLNVAKGDALLFDKSLYHEVAPTEPSALSDVGRWTAVIGGRYPNPVSVSGRARSFCRRIAGKVKRVVVLGVHSRA